MSADSQETDTGLGPTYIKGSSTDYGPFTCNNFLCETLSTGKVSRRDALQRISGTEEAARVAYLSAIDAISANQTEMTTDDLYNKDTATKSFLRNLKMRIEDSQSWNESEEKDAKSSIQASKNAKTPSEQDQARDARDQALAKVEEDKEVFWNSKIDMEDEINKTPSYITGT